MNTNRFAAIDGLRGLAILMVTVLHVVGFLTHGHQHPLIAWWGNGVQLFFCLSGFCLFYPIAKRAKDDKPFSAWSMFYGRRAVRILPGYIAAIVIWAAVTGLWNHPDCLRQIASHLLFVHNFFPDTRSGITGVLWSLGVEANYYLVFPLIAIAVIRSPFVSAICMYTGSVVYQYATICTLCCDRVAIHYSLLGEIGIFALGMLAAHIVVNYPSAAIRKYAPCGIIFLVLNFTILPYIYASKLPSGEMRLLNMLDLFVFGWFAIIVLAAVGKNLIQTIFSFRPLIWAGIISYSLYLYNLMAVDIPNWLGLPSGSVVWLSASIAGIIICGVCGYYLFEYPFMHLREQLRHRNVTFARSITADKCSGRSDDQTASTV